MKTRPKNKNIQSIHLWNSKIRSHRPKTNVCSFVGCVYHHPLFHNFFSRFRILFVLAVFLLVFFSKWNLNLSHADIYFADANSYKCYRSICVKPGDSMELIARDQLNTVDPNQIQDFIAEVCLINHKINTQLRPGDYLIVPYYSNHLFAATQ